MTKRVLLLTVFAATIGAMTLFPSGRANGQNNRPRRVSGQTLTSAHLPAVRIKFDNAFKYVGNQSFVLYEVANAEQHFFVDVDKHVDVPDRFTTRINVSLS